MTQKQKREGEYKRGRKTLERLRQKKRGRKYRWRNEGRDKEAEKIKLKIL